MKSFSLVFVFLCAIAIPGLANAVTCGGKTCGPAGTWVSIGSGVQLRSLGYCVTVSGSSYCAADAARCATGYFSDATTGSVCEASTTKAGYAPRCPSNAGASCFSLICTSCSTYTSDSKATSVVGAAENSCGCYISPSSTVYAGTNGSFKYTSQCYYTDTTDCATARPALITVTDPGQGSACPLIGGGGTVS